MFNSDTWQSHAEYRINFKNVTAKFDSTLRSRLHNVYSEARAKLMSLNLDFAGAYLSQYYSTTGRPAKNQAQILRSLILFVLLFNKTSAGLSLTTWVNETLPGDPVLVALVGCADYAQLPPIGSYYDFMNRLWCGSRKKYSRSFLLPAGKNGRKPKKEIGDDEKLVDPEPEKYSTRDFADKIMAGIETSSYDEGILQDVFHMLAVIPSLKCGLIPLDNLTVSGDGTAVASHASHRGKRQKSCGSPDNCRFHGSCPRHYSDPDAEWGWDSHEKKWYFGHTLYMLCAYIGSIRTDLPLLIRFTSAKRHDSINFLYAIDEFNLHNYSLSPKNICLDSAHDNIPTYELLEYWNMNALIDINARSSAVDGLPDDITLDKAGIPHCMAGHEMCSWGYDKNKSGKKYRCPLMCNRIGECQCQDKCSKSSYGRTIYLKPNGDLRFHTRIPRDSERYKTIYSERTAAERVNNRVLNNYHLHELRIRGIDHFSFWTMLIGICIHLDARHKAGRL